MCGDSSCSHDICPIHGIERTDDTCQSCLILGKYAPAKEDYDSWFDAQPPEVQTSLVDNCLHKHGENKNFKTVAETKKIVQKLSPDIFRDFDLLRAVLRRHEATVRKRWMKKSVEQRRQVLVQAWGRDMHAEHHPNMTEYFNSESEWGMAESWNPDYNKIRDAFFWPYINLEDLTKPTPLLMLLHSRSRYYPSKFAMADIEAARSRRSCCKLQPIILHEYAMSVDAHTPDSYGELRPSNKVCHCCLKNWLSASDGVVLLEIQAKLMEFSLNCAKFILQNDSIDSLLASPIEPPMAIVTSEHSGRRSLGGLVTESYYSIPKSLNFKRIITLLTAKLDSTADHIRAMREDPSYFSNWLLESKEHFFELATRSNYDLHKMDTSNMKHEDIVWAKVIDQETSKAYSNFEMFAELLVYAKRVRVIYKRHMSSEFADKQPPENLFQALLEFRYCLERIMDNLMTSLFDVLVGAPTMRKWFITRPSIDGSLPYTHRINSTLKLNKHQKRFRRLASFLHNDLIGDQFRMYNTIGEMQHIIDKEPSVKCLITSYIATFIGDVSIVAECIRQIDLYQPWARALPQEQIDQKDELEAIFTKRLMKTALLALAGRTHSQDRVRYGLPIGSKFYYPVEKRRTEENTKAMISAEKNLDAFWEKYDIVVKEAIAKRMKMGTIKSDFDNSAIGKLLSESRALQRTAEWVKPVKIKSQPQSVPDLSTLSLNDTYLDLQYLTERTLDTTKDKENTSPKTKLKTRAVEKVAETQPAINQVQPVTTQSQIFHVDKRALKVFKTLFYSPSLDGTPGEVPWLGFVHAMASVGFTAEQLYGSVWQFSPNDPKMGRSIHFHDPHDGKIRYHIARQHGRRLERAYGWKSEIFQEKKKENS